MNRVCGRSSKYVTLEGKKSRSPSQKTMDSKVNAVKGRKVVTRDSKKNPESSLHSEAGGSPLISFSESEFESGSNPLADAASSQTASLDCLDGWSLGSNMFFPDPGGGLMDSQHSVSGLSSFMGSPVSGFSSVKSDDSKKVESQAAPLASTQSSSDSKSPSVLGDERNLVEPMDEELSISCGDDSDGGGDDGCSEFNYLALPAKASEKEEHRRDGQDKNISWESRKDTTREIDLNEDKSITKPTLQKEIIQRPRPKTTKSAFVSLEELTSTEELKRQMSTKEKMITAGNDVASKKKLAEARSSRFYDLTGGSSRSLVEPVKKILGMTVEQKDLSRRRKYSPMEVKDVLASPVLSGSSAENFPVSGTVLSGRNESSTKSLTGKESGKRKKGIKQSHGSDSVQMGQSSVASYKPFRLFEYEPDALDSQVLVTNNTETANKKRWMSASEILPMRPYERKIKQRRERGEVRKDCGVESAADAVLRTKSPVLFEESGSHQLAPPAFLSPAKSKTKLNSRIAWRKSASVTGEHGGRSFSSFADSGLITTPASIVPSSRQMLGRLKTSTPLEQYRTIVGLEKPHRMRRTQRKCPRDSGNFSTCAFDSGESLLSPVSVCELSSVAHNKNLEQNEEAMTEDRGLGHGKGQRKDKGDKLSKTSELPEMRNKPVKSKAVTFVDVPKKNDFKGQQKFQEITGNRKKAGTEAPARMNRCLPYEMDNGDTENDPSEPEPKGKRRKQAGFSVPKKKSNVPAVLEEKLMAEEKFLQELDDIDKNYSLLVDD